MATPTTPEGVIFEVERMALQQAIINDFLQKKLVWAPIDLAKPDLEILDVCCCDGLWLRDVRDNSGNTTMRLYGADINEMMFPKSETPTIQLFKQDFTEPFPANWRNKFDLVHQRFALPAAMGKPMQPIIDSLVDMVKPGGYIQIAELDHNDQPPACESFQTIFKLLAAMLTTWNVGTDYAHKVPGWLNEAGMTEIKIEPVILPFGGAYPGTKEIQDKGTKLFEMTAQPLVMNSSHWPPVPGVMRHQIESLTTDIAKHMPEEGGAYKFFIITARKPL